jgi:hypothetical protein
MIEATGRFWLRYAEGVAEIRHLVVQYAERREFSNRANDACLLESDDWARRCWNGTLSTI